MVLRDQPAVGLIDLGIAGLGGQAQFGVGVLALAQAEPVAVEGVAQQQADDGAEQWIGPEQQRPGDHAQQFSVPAVHAACGARGRIGPIRRF